MTNLDRVLKSKDITLLTKVCIVKAMVFPVPTVGLLPFGEVQSDCPVWVGTKLR